MIDTLVIFGATGDLAGRLLLPAVAALRANGRLGAQFRLLGAAPQERMPDALAHLLHYRQADVTNPADVAAVLDVATQRAPGPVAVYLALPTQLMSDAVRALPPLPAGSRIAVEKPFGHDAGSAVELNTALAALSSVDIDAVYRVDHALAMTGVQHLRAARYPMTGEPIEWSNQRIAQVDLLWEETLALEGRASFYDRAGALRDVMQNHLVQVLCTVAAPPGTAADRSVRHADVLRAVRPMTPADVRRRTRRARYTAGRSAQGSGRDVPDYVAEDGVDPTRDTETFAEVVLELDTPDWVGTRFVLRAGKALAARRRGVAVHLRPTGDGPLWLDLDRPDDDGGADEPTAYQYILADVLGGGSAYAVSAEEAELAWQVFTPVLQEWANDTVAMQSYPAGSSGPR